MGNKVVVTANTKERPEFFRSLKLCQNESQSQRVGVWKTILVARMSPNFECKSTAITMIILVLMTSCLQSVNNVVEEIGHWTQGNSCEQNAGASRKPFTLGQQKRQVCGAFKQTR